MVPLNRREIDQWEANRVFLYGSAQGAIVNLPGAGEVMPFAEVVMSRSETTRPSPLRRPAGFARINARP